MIYPCSHIVDPKRFPGDAEALGRVAAECGGPRATWRISRSRRFTMSFQAVVGFRVPGVWGPKPKGPEGYEPETLAS